jgi:type I restriction enzyme S subunit
MSADWPRVPLGEVLKHRKEFIQIDDFQEYKRCRVQLHAQGVVLRDTVPGVEIKTKKQQVCLAGEFLVAEIDAKLGGYGIVPPDLEGSIVSSHYFLFGINEAKLDRRFLDFYIRTADFFEQVAAQGSTNYAAIRPGHVLAYTMPLPPLAEQRRIVERVEAVAARIADARRLREESRTHAQHVVKQGANSTFEELEAKYEPKRFGDFNPHVTSGPRNWAARYVDAGTRFYRAQDLLLDGRLATSGKVFIEPPDSTQGQGARLCPGDLMLVITGATVGRVAEYTHGLEPGYVSQHVAICRLGTEAVVPRFALWRLLSTNGQDELTGQRYGQGKPGLNLTNIRNLTLPVPPLPEQRRIVAHLDSLQAKADALRALQSETAAELGALLPSVLNRAFAGEM